MEAQETPSPDYVKGFNEGYTIGHHAPELGKELGDLSGDSPRTAGFQAGRQQAMQEKDRGRYPAWLGGNRQHNTTGKTDKDRSIEPER